MSNILLCPQKSGCQLCCVEAFDFSPNIHLQLNKLGNEFTYYICGWGECSWLRSNTRRDEQLFEHRAILKEPPERFAGELTYCACE